jgi:hypothetical protein
VSTLDCVHVSCVRFLVVSIVLGANLVSSSACMTHQIGSSDQRDNGFSSIICNLEKRTVLFKIQNGFIYS